MLASMHRSLEEGFSMPEVFEVCGERELLMVDVVFVAVFKVYVDREAAC